MKISEINIEHLKNYLHIYHEQDNELLSAILVASKAFVRSYTGLSDLALDDSEDLSMAIYIFSI